MTGSFSRAAISKSGWYMAMSGQPRARQRRRSSRSPAESVPASA